MRGRGTVVEEEAVSRFCVVVVWGGRRWVIYVSGICLDYRWSDRQADGERVEYHVCDRPFCRLFCRPFRRPF